MDRLPLIGIWLLKSALLLAVIEIGCGQEKADQPSMSRVAAVTAQKPISDASSWCDVYKSENDALPLVFPAAVPALPAGSLSRPASDRWVWLNLWATWCKPCLREMPLIDRWVESMSHEGAKVDLWFLSVDEDAAELSSFLTRQPDFMRKNSLRISAPDTLQGWLVGLGLPADTTIPVNILAGPGARIRCIRTGSINDGDFPTVKKLILSNR